MKGETDFRWKRLPGRAGSKVREQTVKVSGGEEVASLEWVTTEVRSSGKSQVSSRKAHRKGRNQAAIPLFVYQIRKSNDKTNPRVRQRVVNRALSDPCGVPGN